MPKLLVMDKSIFHGTSTSGLIEFVKNNNVILPFAMVAECLMSETCATDMLQRFQACVKSGAIVGMGLMSVLNSEKQTYAPITSLVDEQATKAILTASFTTDSDILALEAQQCEKTYRTHYERLREFGWKHFVNAEKKKEMVAGFQDDCQNTPLNKRLVKWLRVIDAAQIKILNHFVPEIAKNCDGNWFTWHFIRLHYAWGLEWVCRRSASGSSYEQRDISNDYWDIEYVVCLCRADGLLTADSKLVRPLARAAFPEKEVFSCLEEVPPDYHC